MSDEERLRKANLPKEQSVKYHPFYEGKEENIPKEPIRGLEDFALWYTPGVAEPCLRIKADPSLVWSMTNKWNNVAIVTDGTRILGLGDIGPEAGLPVMEGKSLLFKYLGGVDAYPIPLATKNPEEIIQCVKWLTPAFGGVNLEDISQPKCFYILERLRKETNIAVWHDDQQGTATINVAGTINALKVVGKKLPEATIALVGSGASNIRTAKVLLSAGATPGNLMMVDSKGIICVHRKDLEEKQNEFKEKWELAQITNSGDREGGIPEAMKGTDVVIANPVPEIWPWEAKEAGARVVATGRSDFPNQVNNSLGFPGIFRGTLDVRAKTISDEMCIAAARELAAVAEEKGLSEDYIVPTMDEVEVFVREAIAVAEKAMEQGLARIKRTRADLHEHATKIIERAQSQVRNAMSKGFILPPPK